MGQAIALGLGVLDNKFKDQPLAEARLRFEIGRTLQLLGDKNSALAQSKRAHTLYAQQLGPTHRITLSALNLLALSHTNLGRHADAIPLYEQILSTVDQATMTIQQRQKLQVMNRLNLGTSYRALQRYTDALKMYEQAAADSKQQSSDESPNTLKALYNVALVRADLGDVWEAIRLHQHVLNVRRRVLGADDTDLVSSINALSNCYANLNRIEESLQLREEALSLSRQSRGHAHPDTLRDQAILIIRYSDLGRHADAVRVAEAGVAACLKALGPTDPATLDIRNVLAVQYSRAGRSADSIRTHEENLAARKLVSGPDNLATLAAQGNMARAYSRADRHADALRLHEETLAALNRTVGPANTNTVTANRQYAESLAAAGRGIDAVRVVDDTLPRAAALPNALGVLQQLIVVRTRHFQRANDPAGCRATAELWEKLNRRDSGSLYNAACWRALAAGEYAKANQPAEATADADRAMAWLHKAVASGYRDRAHMQTDTDLDALRGRADFRALLATIPERAPPPRPAP